MIEEAEYRVSVTLTTTIPFSPIERDRAITKQDAIDNALGTVSPTVWDDLEAEGWAIDPTAEKL